MPAAGHISLSKGEVLMYLDLANLNRSNAAGLAGISRRSFFRYMRNHRIEAPKPQSKLTAEKVKQIRVLLGKHPRKQIAEWFGIHEHTVKQIENYETWYWLD